MLVKQLKIKQKDKKKGCLGMLLGTSGSSLLGNLLTSQGRDTIRGGKGTIRAG